MLNCQEKFSEKEQQQKMKFIDSEYIPLMAKVCNSSKCQKRSWHLPFRLESHEAGDADVLGIPLAAAQTLCHRGALATTFLCTFSISATSGHLEVRVF